MKNKFLYVSLLSLLGLLISACSINFTTVINEDGSGEFKFKFTFTEEDVLNIEDEFDDDFDDILDDETGESNFEDICDLMEDEMDIDAGSRAKAEYFETASEFVCEITIEFDDIDELLEIYEEMDLGEIYDIDLDRDGNLIYEIDVDMTYANDEDEFGVNDVEYLWIVTVPGTVEDSNADERKGRTLTWELEAGEIVSIELEGGPGNIFTSLGDISAIWWLSGFGLLCLCSLAIIGGGAGFYFYTKKKKEAK